MKMRIKKEKKKESKKERCTIKQKVAKKTNRGWMK